MSCTTNPVNIRDTNQICKEECSYEFNYNPNSSAIVTNNGTYLDIKVDGDNDIKFNNYKIALNDVRIYQPSLHLFKGHQAEAELIISHSGYGQSILVCVPITVRDGQGKSNNFFSQIISHISPYGEAKTEQSINVSKWSLNDVIPSSTFYFYVGKYPYPPCNGKVNVIVFGPEDTARINSEDMKKLRSLLQPVEYSQDQTLGSAASKKPLLMINKASGGGGGGSIGPNSEERNGYYILDECVAVNGMDDKSTKKKKPVDISGWVTMIMLLLGGLIILALIYSFASGFHSDNSGSGTQAPSTAQSAGGRGNR